jgi:serine/threonine-protein kinase
MSVVYKGMDTSLNREVAVKVLHPHLAAAHEARDRFEREAHAVAKLRHENILEIFDYSGKTSRDSYIVTEFIRGRTLRVFMAERPIAFPEVAALITVEVCRALAHAHSLGVLHRDVKPENIMIRDDGVLKLMDFGIAQIVDSQRMTVTGQLLGSPAYMSPEHIEGRPLDFRTDVFSVGILLYQLATGELPFKGRNPHEILKRIAECRYLEARVVNPLVADRLNQIIARALARLPDDRYGDVTLLLADLTAFLVEVELGDARAELVRFFAQPVAYEQALRERLVTVLTRRGHEALAAKRTARAMEMWNRVLTIDPTNAEVLRAIDGLSRRRRLRSGAVAGLGLVALTGSVVLAWDKVIAASSDARPPVSAPLPAVAAPAVAAPAAVVSEPAPPVPPQPVASFDAGVVTVAVAAPRIEPPPPRPAARPPAPAPTPAPTPPRPVLPAVPAVREVRLVTSPKSAWYRVDGGDWTQISMGAANLKLGPGAHRVDFKHPLCDERSITIAADDLSLKNPVVLPWKPTKVRARCDRASAIGINDRPVASGDAVDILDFNSFGRARVSVDFSIDGRLEHHTADVAAGDAPREVKCDAD